MNHDVVPVALCRKLEKAIGRYHAKWASGPAIVALHSCRNANRKDAADNFDETPIYTLGDLLAYCRSRKWGVVLSHRVDFLCPHQPYARVITEGKSGNLLLDGFGAEAKTMPAALALAVLAAAKGERP